MIRTFHPVGQGAFYSERHGDFNIVYDCGTTSHVRARPIVEQAFKDEVVDILFISHFDNDHISSIPDLKKSTKQIKVVVLPLLNNQQRNLLLNFYHHYPAELRQIIEDPESYFGSNTTIIKVLPVNDIEDRNRDYRPLILEDIINSESKSITEIESGTPLTIQSSISNQTINWVFIPYNYEDKVRRLLLSRELNKVGFSTNMLENDADYVINSLKSAVIRPILHSIYDKLAGKINENSMLLYSGPDLSNNSDSYKPYHTKSCKYLSFSLNGFYTCLCMSGCIYTGDSDFHCYKLKDIYPDYVDFVDVIQVPHHGSKNDFDLQALEGFSNTILPISHSTTSKYHPAATVVKELIINGFNVVSVNENINSEFKQYIW
ncbi:MBL fold metallo-hydrolase [Psychrobacter sp. FDAARGOS_221]|uniref:MBL fold metallo-hydrolase n=1 Tax=Psychrobacter sp. FDAARGOS_221 TaxID=1975705 RepID=UPI000BB56EAD|nr:MBL fold metallo-hydrolase [Psychrobacter sp. FDAARGOS_221]PNK59499.1 hypothetical protein A6J60_000425 [Psychrobacter sp. FDAARGOS_221]